MYKEFPVFNPNCERGKQINIVFLAPVGSGIYKNLILIEIY